MARSAHIKIRCPDGSSALSVAQSGTDDLEPCKTRARQASLEAEPALLMNQNDPSTTESTATLLESAGASVVATSLTALFIYPWVTRWFHTSPSEFWAWYFFPTSLVAMAVVGFYAARWVRRRWLWVLMPLLSYMIGIPILFFAWHNFYNWQTLPTPSLAILTDTIPYWAFVGVFLGLWLPGLWWTLSIRMWSWSRTRWKWRFLRD